MLLMGFYRGVLRLSLSLALRVYRKRVKLMLDKPTLTQKIIAQSMWRSKYSILVKNFLNNSTFLETGNNPTNFTPKPNSNLNLETYPSACLTPPSETNEHVPGGDQSALLSPTSQNHENKSLRDSTKNTRSPLSISHRHRPYLQGARLFGLVIIYPLQAGVRSLFEYSSAGGRRYFEIQCRVTESYVCSVVALCMK